ncbi:hypothetical protein MN608_01730 [Microdochium nivale]|nr:hypothetical protein MN608_01730 [Microdochium nivale]
MAWAVQNDDAAVVEVLFDAGARSLDEGPWTMLSWAMEYGHFSSARHVADPL